MSDARALPLEGSVADRAVRLARRPERTRNLVSLTSPVERLPVSSPGSALVDLLPIAVICLDEMAEAVFVNAAWLTLTGRGVDAELGSGWTESFLPDERAIRTDWIRRGAQERRAVAKDIWVSTVIGQRLLRMAGQPHLDRDGALRSYVVCATDVTEQVAREDRLSHAARHDALTGLANRAGFLEAAARVASEATRSGSTAALLFVDLDDFKLVNDIGGHAVGDEVLRIVANRLEAAIRPADVVARFGGDEFAVMLVDVDSVDDALAVAERMLHGLTASIAVQGLDWRLGASIGVALTIDDNVTDLLERADASLYAAKSRGKNAVIVSESVPTARVESPGHAETDPGVDSASSSALGAAMRPFHGVHFYTGDDDLMPTLSGYVDAGLLQDAVIVVATPEHRLALRGRMDDRRLEQARAEGRYIELDAAETLRRFMRNGSPDPELFRMVVVNPLLHAAVKHGRLHVFGEMVGLLWADGRTAAALQLEQLWNDLQANVSFALLCAYPLSAVDIDAGDGFRQICAQHSAVLSAG